MTDAPHHLPLWRAIQAAEYHSPKSYIVANEIRAVRDWLFSAGRPGDDSCCDVMQARLWDQLTTEADRAEASHG